MSTAAATSSASSLVARFRIREVLNAGKSATKPGSTTKAIPNPFLPQYNAATKRWAPPKYSLRRQADLIKEAKRTGVEHLLPPVAKPATLVAKHKQVSPILQLLHERVQSASPTSATAPTEPAKVDTEVTWLGEAKDRTSFGLYGKRQKMFKGHKWEKEVKLRRAAMRKVVKGLDAQKRNMRYGRVRKARRPKAKYPI